MAFSIAWLAIAMALAGTIYTAWVTFLVRRFDRRLDRIADAVPPAFEPITLLKPLHGAEPRLAENLSTFLAQRWPAPVQLLAGVQAPTDPAADVVRSLPVPAECRADLVMDATRHGANAKVGNLINMAPSIAHDVVILSDSDIAAPPGYFAVVTAALAEPGVGAVTCLYAGRGDAGLWSVLGAAGLSYHFLPSVLASLALNAGDVCMGSTIALRRETLAQIGGFERFADVLADDHAIGAAIRAQGLRVAVPPILVTHASAEPTFAALARHELRWAATVRSLNPAGYAGLVVAMPLPFALASAMLMPCALTLGLLGITLAARLLLAKAVDAAAARTTAPALLLPLRDLLTFAIFVASFFVRSVEWRGKRLRMEDEGRITADPALPANHPDRAR